MDRMSDADCCPWFGCSYFRFEHSSDSCEFGCTYLSSWPSSDCFSGLCRDVLHADSKDGSACCSEHKYLFARRGGGNDGGGGGGSGSGGGNDGGGRSILATSSSISLETFRQLVPLLEHAVPSEVFV